VSTVLFDFVIPVLNEQERVTQLLKTLGKRYPDSGLIVVDGGSSDDTVARALPYCSSLVTSDPGRAQQMNLGASAATGDYVVFLHVDSVPTVSGAELAHILSANPQWGFCRARLSGNRRIFRIIEWAMNRRSRMTHVATGDQMLFVQRQLLEQIGGFADISLMEDVELCKRLRKLAVPMIVQQPVVTSSRRWEARGVLRTIIQMWLLRLGYFLGVSPNFLRGHYYG